MDTDEEYLDSLLKSIAGGKKEPRKTENSFEDRSEITEKKVDSMINGRDERENGQALGAQNGAGDNGPDGSGGWPSDLAGDSGDWDINIDQLLEQADMLVSNDMLPPMPGFEAGSAGETDGKKASPAGAGREATQKATEEKKDMKKAVAADTSVPEGKSAALAKERLEADKSSGVPSDADIDSDLDEINSLLQQADLNEKVDEDMLALLESATESQEEENPDEVFDIFAEGDMPMDVMAGSNTSEPEGEEDAPEVKKGSKKKKEKKQKKEKGKKAVSDKSDRTAEKKKGDKPGFLAKLKEIFAQNDEWDEDDEKSSASKDAENEIISALNEAEEKGASKSARKSKKKADNKEKKSAKTAKPKKAKVSRAKKASIKKKEAARPEAAEKQVKILNGKSFTAILGLCLSIIAAVLIVTTFLPEYANRKNASQAYRDRDYGTVYRLLYGKNMGGSEELIYNQSKTILQLERRLKSYQNNIALGRELQAVDALLMGIESYQDLPEADTYNVRGEVDALYQQICSILESNYGISQEEALVLNGYDEIAYTKALYALVGGTGVDFSAQETGNSDAQSEAGTKPSDGEEIPAQTQAGESNEALMEDMLPEEEDILNR